MTARPQQIAFAPPARFAQAAPTKRSPVVAPKIACAKLAVLPARRARTRVPRVPPQATESAPHAVPARLEPTRPPRVPRAQTACVLPVRPRAPAVPTSQPPAHPPRTVFAPPVEPLVLPASTSRPLARQPQIECAPHALLVLAVSISLLHAPQTKIECVYLAAVLAPQVPTSQQHVRRQPTVCAPLVVVLALRARTR